ncbi:IS4 family transposase, partial [Xanthobacteraceae bacterium Astr-EGSB]|uniref:IS4 family transposase n=1 Tax=Astrobacterium formosum TaxID=3069710 RepID=UPI0027B5F487|nr:IS4 family transposase [Xanthobacteraceae bacterium Astr-EGSB]
LAGAQSLREIEGGLSSHAHRLYHLGAREVSRSTLADANAKRPHAVFGALFAHLVRRAGRSLRRKVGEAVHLVDSSGLRLSELSADWAHFSDGVCGAKLHVVYDADGGYPLDATITPARVNDITAAQSMPIAAGATYVFDLGYYDYAWWARLDAAGCRIVTRLKSNTPVTVVAENSVDGDDPAILSDCIGYLPARLAASRSNPFRAPVREIRVRIDSGKVLRILSNDLDAPAGEIASLYKRRWQIELFFRWIKQTLKIKHFLGTSENAVRIQIAIALIAYLLLRLAHAAQHRVDGLLAFTRLVRSNLMHRRHIDALLEPPLIFQDQRQLSLPILQP